MRRKTHHTKRKTGLQPKPYSKTKNQGNALKRNKKKERKENTINELKNIPEGEIIFVRNASGEPLDPTRRHHHAQKLLDTGKAKLVSQHPWVIQLKYDITNPITSEYVGAIDPGRTNIGIAIINTTQDKVVLLAKAETRNKDIPKLMSARAQHRQASRRGERLRRKRRSHRLGQSNKKITADGGRYLKSCAEIIPVKDIINTEARFSNRRRPKGWLTPTATQLVRTHLSLAHKFCKLLPIKRWCIEWNKFAFMKLDDGSVRGVDFQNGRLRDFGSVNDYVHARQEGECGMPGCQHKIEHYHHIIPRHEGGSDLPDNIIGLCKECHEGVHTGKLSVPAGGFKKKYGALSVLNQAIPFIYEGLAGEFGGENVFACSGYDTKQVREELGLPKDHDLDALSIFVACSGVVSAVVDDSGSVRVLPVSRTVHQFRRHDRARVRAQYERAYKLGDVTIAKNRCPRFEQPVKFPALSGAGLSREEVSRLAVRRSYRAYKEPWRLLPGALFFVEDRVCVLSGVKNGGRYLLFKWDFVDDKGKPVPVRASDCELLCLNKGLVFSN